MRPLLNRVIRQILPAFLVYTSMCQAADPPVLNELNSAVEEPLVYLPEFEATSPFRSVSRQRNPASSISQNELVHLVEDAVDSARRRLLSTNINTPWQMMHGLLALRRDFQIRQNNRIVSGLDWVSSGPSYESEPWFEKTQYGGRAHPYSRPWAFEGHANQFLAALSMSALPLNHELLTADGPITIAHMVEHAQKTVNLKDEPTWTLWALSRYLPPDAAWRNASGENWSIERLVSIQTARPLQGTACGGTHGLFALAHARNVYLRSGKPVRGAWLEAEYKIRRQINTAHVQQNSNGMLSSNYFRGREYKHDFNKRMASAGHILEFLMLALPQDELHEAWVHRAIRATAQDLLKNRHLEVRCSPLYHAVNALNIYLDRMKQQLPPEVARTADTEAPLKPIDDRNSVSLKNTPATKISASKPVLPEVNAPTALKTAKDRDAETPAGRADPAPTNLPTPVASSTSRKERWQQSLRSESSSPKTAERKQEVPKRATDTEESLLGKKTQKL